MGSWYRSEEMEYVELILSEDAAHSCIRELGQLGCVQFTDLNPDLTPFQRRYVAYIKRCDEIERKIRFFNTEIKKHHIQAQPAGSVDEFVANGFAVAGREAVTGQFLLDMLESDLQKKESQLLELNAFNERLASDYMQKLEFHHVLDKVRRSFLLEAAAIQADLQNSPHLGGPPQQGLDMPLLGANAPPVDQELRFSHITGVISAEDRGKFERMLFRSTRGNCYVRFAQIEEPLVDVKTGKAVASFVFVIYYKSSAIENKIKRICDSFNAHRYHVDTIDDAPRLDAMLQHNAGDLNESKTVLDKNDDARRRLCSELSIQLERWLWTVRQEKAVYHTLNLFKSEGANILHGQGWILKNSVEQAKSALIKAHLAQSLPATSLIQPVHGTWPTPPTWFNTNKFTYAFQEFVDTYGVPRYREINPALFTAATFPFLFGVMYADMGHGLCLVIGALYLVFTESNANRRDTPEMMKGLYSARYMLLLMGIMSVYCGLIYNDYFSIGLDIFGSKWHWVNNPTSTDDDEAVYKSGKLGDPANVYPVGVDPAWHIASNELLFFNSLKMKISVILGIVQMSFGIILRGINATFFNSRLDFYCEFVPMIVFATSFFGYMVFLIFYKWSINWDHRMFLASCICDSTNTNCFRADTTETCSPDDSVADLCPLDMGGSGDGCQPPNLITTLINVMLAPGSVDEPMYNGQAEVQTAILLIAFICVPWLLMAKPIILNNQAKARRARHSVHSEADEHALVGHEEGHGNHEEHGFGEIMIHQAIETIEFVLGMVSNTASYLRLWALSLAHTELAAVFWEKAMLGMIEAGSPIAIFVGYAVFACVTIGVLLMMDVLECFLHALRLHWVEFQNKFYKADGYKFQPFSFSAILNKSILE